MDFAEIYHFLFETFPGIGCLIGIGLVVALVASIILERGTRKKLQKRREEAQDQWVKFEDSDNS